MSMSLCVGASACNEQSAIPKVFEQETAEVGTAAICNRIRGSTGHGDLSMRAAFESTKDGMDYGGGVIDALLKQDGYRFIGAEMVGPSCWAYAEAKGTEWNKPFYLKWRCPVQAVDTDPAKPSEKMVALVDDRLCEFGKERGAPVEQPVELDIMQL